ncbi:hypothetical protein MRX96_058707 [Rhipicephalus microplus]
MATTTPPQDEEIPDSEAVLDTESCASISHLEQQESEDADNILEALIEQLQRVHAEEKSNAAYRKHLLSGTKRLRKIQEQKRGVGAMMAMDAALVLEFILRSALTLSCQQLNTFCHKRDINAENCTHPDTLPEANQRTQRRVDERARSARSPASLCRQERRGTPAAAALENEDRALGEYAGAGVTSQF